MWIVTFGPTNANNDHACMNKAESHRTEEVKAYLLAKFGPFMNAKEVVTTLKLTSVDALRMARKRGTLDLDPLPVSGRRSLLFATDQVARVANELMHAAARHKEPTM